MNDSFRASGAAPKFRNAGAALPNAGAALPNAGAAGARAGAEDGAPGRTTAGADGVDGAVVRAPRMRVPGTPRVATAPCAPGGARGAGAASVARGGAARAIPTAPREAPAPVDAELVVYRLEEAGRTLLALPQTGYSTRLRTSSLDYVRSALDGAGAGPTRGETARLRPAMPDSARIDRMDEAYGWIPLIPPDRFVLRRIVGARSLVSPVTERHLFAWRRLASLLGADHKAVQRWHAQGIALIVAALRG